jgi:hypothetical protein
MSKRRDTKGQISQLAARARCRAFAQHRASDPHCTCPDCIEHHAAQLDDADDPTSALYLETPQPTIREQIERAIDGGTPKPIRATRRAAVTGISAYACELFNALAELLDEFDRYSEEMRVIGRGHGDYDKHREHARNVLAKTTATRA